MKTSTVEHRGGQWKVHTPNLLQEILGNPGTSILARPIQIFGGYLYELGEVAARINDPELNRLMCLLTIYTIADPLSEDYNPEAVDRLININ